MKLKKILNYKSENQVWRILISDADYLIIENRNSEKKQVYFNCFNLVNRKEIFSGLQLAETYWIGIEKVLSKTILFHGFAKPDMPAHKGIIAFNIDTQKIIWENPNYNFLFFWENKIYCFIQKFEGREYFTVDSLTGNFIEDLNLSDNEINELRKRASSNDDYSSYIFPQFLNSASTTAEIKNHINRFTEGQKIMGEVEFAFTKDLLVFNYHSEVSKNNLVNNLFCYNISKEKILLNEIINRNVFYPAPDSFFIYKNLLIFVKDKTEVMVYELE